MARKSRPKLEAIEVDMVPFIDIVTLLLMFLIIVGDMAKSASGVKMKLPRADQAKFEKELNVDTSGRLVVQLRKDPADGRYWAVVETCKYQLVPRGDNPDLIKYFQFQIDSRISQGRCKRGPDGSVNFPVKLRVPADASMLEVERVMMTLAKAGLVNVHYAAYNIKQAN
jgi:biopolymer transport protein ExbD